MDEKTFWIALEFRICREFSGMPERHRRYWWCDGFEPKQYHLDSPEPTITGKAWICNGRKQDIWRFTLFLDKNYPSPQEVDWAGLLPPEEVTCWVAINEAGKQIQIEPAAAVPDFPISS